LAVPMFQQREDPIECVNKAMAFLSAVASRFLSSNNQLITSSNHIIKQPFKMVESQFNKFKEDKLRVMLTKDSDAYDSDCDDLSFDKAVLMANLSSYDPEVLFEVSIIKQSTHNIIQSYNQATIQDGRVTVQQVQGRQTQSYAGTRNRGIATTSMENYAAGQPRVVKCYNC
nr:hypothetical protein [Tanacetum cinerariifolium]